MKRLALFIGLLVWSLGLFAQTKGIPDRYRNDPAVDLTQNGRLLTPEAVHQLQTGRGKFDISTLNPIETSDLWKNVMPATLPEERTPINAMDEVSYHSPVKSPSGIFRFNILNKKGDGKIYTMMLSKTVHSILLAKSLLRKIGYQIPDVKYLPRINLQFKTELEKKGFISYLETVAFAGSSKAWIVDETETSLILQDLVVMESTHIIYNLAVNVTPDMIQGRRLLSSLAIPLTIVNLSESVNLLRWTAGVESNNSIYLYNDNLDDFACSWDDARWISRRIEKLTREEWKDIVASSHIPKAVQQVLVEKIISRRNSVMKLFKIDSEEIPVDGKINNGVEIVDGKITQQKWPGYASRFAYGDPDSPLSDADVKTWVKSRAISSGMDVVINQLNRFFSTDIAKFNKQKYQEYVAAAQEQATKNNKPFEMPLKAWTFPTFRGNVIVSRNLVTGTYLGTDNLVQLVDTVGISVGAGMSVGTMGISYGKSKTEGGKGIHPITVVGGVEGSILRTYSHLRPVTKLKKSLKYPYKNIFVPLVQNNYGELLHDAAMVSIDPNASEDVKKEKITRALKPFKDSIAIGESLLVTDSIITAAAAQASASLYGKLATISLGVQPGYQLVSRFHVYRKSEDEFHIYKDVGQKGQVSVGFSLDSLIPVLSANFKKSAGGAKVKFYSVKMNWNNPNIIKNMIALRGAIINSSTGELEENDNKPIVLNYTYKEGSPSLNVFFWQFVKQNQSTNITITNPVGEKKYYRRHYYGTTQGRNYQAYVVALINQWVGMLFDVKAGLNDGTGINPGYSYKGHAVTKFLTLDEEIDEKGNTIEPFIALSRVWNGWKIDRKKAERILDDIRQRYRFQFYNGPILNDTHAITLYNISVNMLFYKAGIEHLMGLDEKTIKRVFLEHQVQDSLVITPQVPPENADADLIEDKLDGTGVQRFLRLMGRFKKYEAKGHVDRSDKNLLKALSFMEKRINVEGISKLMGGDENIYVVSKITGFRDGDEAGDQSILSNSLGEYGSPEVLGPVQQMQRRTGMLEGEFFINWMMQRLI